MKNGSKANAFHLVAFILFVIWGVGTLINFICARLGLSFNIDGRILTICAFAIMFYCACLFYIANKKNKLVTWLFWISFSVGIAVVVLPFIF